MTLDFKLDFYNIAKCGFYEGGAFNTDFGTVSEMMEDFQNWIIDKPLFQTKTYDLGQIRDLLPVYCFNLQHNPVTNDYLLVTWNELPFEDGNVPSVNGSEQVGSVHINLTPIPENNIPGYATYFWILPNYNTLITVRPEGQALNGHQNLKNYFAYFLRYFTRYTVFDEATESFRYSFNDNPEETQIKLYAKFETYLKRKQTERDFLINNNQDIYKIIRKDKFKFVSQETNVPLIEQILRAVLLGGKEPLTVLEKNYKIELDYDPSREDIIQIVDKWDLLEDDSDVGFKFSGQQGNIVWLSKTYEKHETSLDIVRNPNEVLDAGVLLELLSNQRERFIRLANLTPNG